MSLDYFDQLRIRLWKHYPELGALPRLESKKWLNMTRNYMSKLDNLGQGPEKVRIGRKIHYPIDSLVGWLRDRA